MNGAGVSATAGQEEPRAILVRTPNWLGDLMMSTSFLGTLLERFPDVPVDLIVRQGFDTLPLPHRGSIFPFDKRKQWAGTFGKGFRGRRFNGRRFNGKEYSHIFVLPPSFSSAWMAFRSGIPNRIGYRGEGRSPLLRPALRHPHPHRSVHLVEEYFHLLAPWMETGAGPRPPALLVDDSWRRKHMPESTALHAPYVVLVPGAEYGPAKQWPPRHYGKVAAALHQAGWKVVVAGLADDWEAGGEILAGIGDGLNLCGATSLPELTALLAGAVLVISNDSGAMHLAAALHRPQIALFGSSDPAWTAPLNDWAAVFHLGLSCSPCFKRSCPLGHTDCLNTIEPEGVIVRAIELLREMH